MARGWESKAVEDQLNEHDAAGIVGDQDKLRLTDAERARQNSLRSLQLSRSRIANQLSSATIPAHRTILERALKALDKQMVEIEDKSSQV